jgi:hypothetical protein
MELPWQFHPDPAYDLRPESTYLILIFAELAPQGATAASNSKYAIYKRCFYNINLMIIKDNSRLVSPKARIG